MTWAPGAMTIERLRSLIMADIDTRPLHTTACQVVGRSVTFQSSRSRRAVSSRG